MLMQVKHIVFLEQVDIDKQLAEFVAKYCTGWDQTFIMTFIAILPLGT